MRCRAVSRASRRAPSRSPALRAGPARACPRCGPSAGSGRATSGSHQLRSPSSSIVAGTSTMRTIVASTSTATASPRPNSFSDRSSPSTNAENTHTMISAAAVITRAVAARPSATAVALSLRAVVLLLHAREQEDLVVHRQAEHDREHHHRRPRLDRAFAVDADEAGAPAPLEHGDDDAVRRTDRQQVHDDGLERHEQRPEHDHQQQEAEDEHRTDQVREPVAEVVGEVDRRRVEPADRRVDTGRRARRRRAGGARAASVSSSCGALSAYTCTSARSSAIGIGSVAARDPFGVAQRLAEPGERRGVLHGVAGHASR